MLLQRQVRPYGTGKISWEGTIGGIIQIGWRSRVGLLTVAAAIIALTGFPVSAHADTNRLVLGQHQKLTGDRWYLTGDNPDLSSIGANDRASSVYNDSPVAWVLSQNQSGGGRIYCIPPGGYVADLHAEVLDFGDRTSSVTRLLISSCQGYPVFSDPVTGWARGYQPPFGVDFLKLYRDYNFNGLMQPPVFLESIPNFSDYAGIDDQANSVFNDSYSAWVLYQHDDSNGIGFCVEPGQRIHDLYSLTDFADRMSSARRLQTNDCSGYPMLRSQYPI